MVFEENRDLKTWKIFISIYTPFTEEKRALADLALYKLNSLFRILHAAIADIRFLGKWGAQYFQLKKKTVKKVITVRNNSE